MADVLEEVAALDALGRHGEALDLLARATRGGDRAAKRVLGRRIMAGDRAPHYGPQGAELLAEAAAEGDAEAMALCAPLAGMGRFRRQSWADALDYLLNAAVLDHEDAQGQLRVLAGAAAGAGGDDWAALRAACDPGALLAAPAGRTLCERPRVFTFEGFADAATCAWLIRRAAARLEPAMVYDPANGRGRQGDSRTSSNAPFVLSQADLVQVVVQARIARAVAAPFAHLEAANILNYRPGQEFGDHYDFLDASVPAYAADIARTGQRVITLLLYLNDGYEGGDTAFPRAGISHHGGAGDALMFFNTLPDGAPDMSSLHAGRPPLSGEKWVLSQWIRSRPAARTLSPTWRP